MIPLIVWALIALGYERMYLQTRLMPMLLVTTAAYLFLPGQLYMIFPVVTYTPKPVLSLAVRTPQRVLILLCVVIALSWTGASLGFAAPTVEDLGVFLEDAVAAPAETIVEPFVESFQDGLLAIEFYEGLAQDKQELADLWPIMANCLVSPVLVYRGAVEGQIYIRSRTTAVLGRLFDLVFKSLENFFLAHMPVLMAGVSGVALWQLYMRPGQTTSADLEKTTLANVKLTAAIEAQNAKAKAIDATICAIHSRCERLLSSIWVNVFCPGARRHLQILETEDIPQRLTHREPKTIEDLSFQLRHRLGARPGLNMPTADQVRSYDPVKKHLALQAIHDENLTVLGLLAEEMHHLQNLQPRLEELELIIQEDATSGHPYGRRGFIAWTPADSEPDLRRYGEYRALKEQDPAAPHLATFQRYELYLASGQPRRIAASPIAPVAPAIIESLSPTASFVRISESIETRWHNAQRQICNGGQPARSIYNNGGRYAFPEPRFPVPAQKAARTNTNRRDGHKSHTELVRHVDREEPSAVRTQPRNWWWQDLLQLDVIISEASKSEARAPNVPGKTLQTHKAPSKGASKTSKAGPAAGAAKVPQIRMPHLAYRDAQVATDESSSESSSPVNHQTSARAVSRLSPAGDKADRTHTAAQSKCKEVVVKDKVNYFDDALAAFSGLRLEDLPPLPPSPTMSDAPLPPLPPFPTAKATGKKKKAARFAVTVEDHKKPINGDPAGTGDKVREVQHHQKAGRPTAARNTASEHARSIAIADLFSSIPQHIRLEGWSTRYLPRRLVKAKYTKSNPLKHLRKRVEKMSRRRARGGRRVETRPVPILESTDEHTDESAAAVSVEVPVEDAAEHAADVSLELVDAPADGPADAPVDAPIAGPVSGPITSPVDAPATDAPPDPVDDPVSAVPVDAPDAARVDTSGVPAADAPVNAPIDAPADASADVSNGSVHPAAPAASEKSTGTNTAALNSQGSVATTAASTSTPAFVFGAGASEEPAGDDLKELWVELFGVSPDASDDGKADDEQADDAVVFDTDVQDPGFTFDFPLPVSNAAASQSTLPPLFLPSNALPTNVLTAEAPSTATSAQPVPAAPAAVESHAQSTEIQAEDPRNAVFTFDFQLPVANPFASQSNVPAYQLPDLTATDDTVLAVPGPAENQAQHDQIPLPDADQPDTNSNSDSLEDMLQQLGLADPDPTEVEDDDGNNTTLMDAGGETEYTGAEFFHFSYFDESQVQNDGTADAGVQDNGAQGSASQASMAFDFSVFDADDRRLEAFDLEGVDLAALGLEDTDIADADIADTGVFNAGGSNAGAFDAGSFDAGVLDAFDSNAGLSNAGASNAGAVNTGSFNAGVLDDSAFDGSAFDAGAFDGSAFDAGAFDTGAFDTGAFDASAFDAGTFGAGTFDTGAFDASTFSTGDFNTGAANTGASNTDALGPGVANTGFFDAGALGAFDFNAGFSNAGVANTDAVTAAGDPDDDEAAENARVISEFLAEVDAQPDLFPLGMDPSSYVTGPGTGYVEAHSAGTLGAADAATLDTGAGSHGADSLAVPAVSLDLQDTDLFAPGDFGPESVAAFESATGVTGDTDAAIEAIFEGLNLEEPANASTSDHQPELVLFAPGDFDPEGAAVHGLTTGVTPDADAEIDAIFEGIDLTEAANPNEQDQTELNLFAPGYFDAEGVADFAAAMGVGGDADDEMDNIFAGINTSGANSPKSQPETGVPTEPAENAASAPQDTHDPSELTGSDNATAAGKVPAVDAGAADVAAVSPQDATDAEGDLSSLFGGSDEPSPHADTA